MNKNSIRGLILFGLVVGLVLSLTPCLSSAFAQTQVEEKVDQAQQQQNYVPLCSPNDARVVRTKHFLADIG